MGGGYLSLVDLQTTEGDMLAALLKFHRFLVGFSVADPDVTAHFERLSTPHSALEEASNAAKYGFTNQKSLLWTIAELEPTGISQTSYNYFFDALVKNGLVDILHNQEPSILINRKKIRLFEKIGILDNVLGGFPYIIKKYRSSIFEIIIEDENGDTFSGTGFLASQSEIITNAHVLRRPETGIPYKILEIRSPGHNISIKDVDFVDGLDLAIVHIAPLISATPFVFDRTDVLDEVIAVGFPRVAMSDSNPLLISEGAVNGYFQSYIDSTRYAVVDAKISPGNSGGPVLNKYGMVCGIVTQDVHSSLGALSYSHSCMIPSEENFLGRIRDTFSSAASYAADFPTL